MNISLKGIDILKKLEDCKLKAYKDQGGVWTIGYGSTAGVIEGMTITQEQAESRLINKLNSVSQWVSSHLTRPVLQYQFDALVIFTYNVGNGAFAGSTLLKCVNSGDTASAANEFMKWVNVNHVQNNGLVNRRKAEQSLYLNI